MTAHSGNITSSTELSEDTLWGSTQTLLLYISLTFTHTSKAEKNQMLSFIRNRDHSFMLIQKHTEWWNWSQTGLIESLYEHTSAQTEVSYDFKLQRDLKLQVGEENSDHMFTSLWSFKIKISHKVKPKHHIVTFWCHSAATYCDWRANPAEDWNIWHLSNWGLWPKMNW